MDSVLGVVGFILAVLVGLFLLVFLVVIHELGHAIVARRNGVVVEEFGIGFPPKAWGKQLKNGVLFTINWLPLGGFVKLKGEHDADTTKGGYGSASLWVKTKILLAGVVMNLVGAMVIFTGLALFGSLPKVLDNQYQVSSDTTIERSNVMAVRVNAGSPAEKAGLQTGDELLVVANNRVDSPEELIAITKANAGKTVDVVYGRDNVEQTAAITLNKESQPGQGYLGIGSNQLEYIRATWSAPLVGAGTTLQFAQVTLIETGKLLGSVAQGIASKLSSDDSTRQAGSDALSQANQGVAGPIGILGQLFPSAVDAGIVPLLFLTGIISLTLAVMNVLPIPALDGGRLFVTLLFRALRKPLTKEREEAIQATGFLSLMGLVVLITVLDIGKLAN